MNKYWKGREYLRGISVLSVIKKIKFLNTYYHPVLRGNNFVCGDCWKKIDDSEIKYSKLISNSISKESGGCTCFILIKTLTGKEKFVYNKISEIPKIIEINHLLGSYDIIIKLKIENMLDFLLLNVDEICIMAYGNNSESIINELKIIETVSTASKYKKNVIVAVENKNLGIKRKKETFYSSGNSIAEELSKVNKKIKEYNLNSKFAVHGLI